MLTPDSKRILALELFRTGHICLWSRGRPEGWVLASGLWSPFYVQLRNVGSHPSLVRMIGDAFADLLQGMEPTPTRLVGIAMAGVPLSVAASLSSGIPFAYTRKVDPTGKAGLQAYGQHGLVEGDLIDDDVVVMVDDVATMFTTKVIARDMVQEFARVREVSVVCSTVAVVIDREQGAREEATRLGMGLHSLLRFESEALPWIGEELSPQERDVIHKYLADPQEFQNEEARHRLLGSSR